MTAIRKGRKGLVTILQQLLVNVRFENKIGVRTVVLVSDLQQLLVLGHPEHGAPLEVRLPPRVLRA